MGVAGLAFGVSGFICESLTSMAECADSTPTKSIERVCLSPSSKEQICLLCAKVDDLRGPEKRNLFQSRVNTGKGDFTTKKSLTSAHILNLQRLFNTRISLPVTLTGSELTPQLNPSMKTFKSSKNAFVLEVTLTISEKKSPMRLNLPNVSQLYKRTMKCEKKFCLSLPRTTLLCILMSKWHLKSKIAERYPR